MHLLSPTLAQNNLDGVNINELQVEPENVVSISDSSLKSLSISIKVSFRVYIT